MSGIVGSRHNIRGSGLVGSLGTDGQVFTSAGAGTGAVFEDAAGGGKILQVVEGAHTGPVSTTSTSYVTTNLDASITPAASSSKVLILCTFTAQASHSDASARYTLYQSADLDTEAIGLQHMRGNVANLFGTIHMTFVHSPSTTSEVTYTAYFKNPGSGTSYAMAGGSLGRIVLMEIGA